MAQTEPDRYLLGFVHAYFELLHRGVRDVCLPSFGAPEPSDLDWLEIQAREEGLATLLVRKQARRSTGEAVADSYHCQRVVFVPEAEEKALALRALLESSEMDKERNRERNRRIGELLGYHPDKIEEFVSGASR